MSLRAPGQSRLTGLLALVCAGLLVLIFLQLDEAAVSRAARSTPSEAAHRAPAVDLEADDLEFEMPPLSLYSDITSRPLFSPTRRPPPPDEAPVNGEPEAVNVDLVLRGVATAEETRAALIEERGTGKLIRALVGQSVGGWRITAIRREVVELEGRGETLVLEIEEDSSPPAALQRARQRRLQRADPGDRASDDEAVEREQAEPAEPDAEEQEDRPAQ